MRTPKRIEQAARERAELKARVPELERQWEQAVYEGDDEAAQRLERERRGARDALADLERRCEVLRQRRRDELAEAKRREAEKAGEAAAGELRELASQFATALEAMEAAEKAIGAIDDEKISAWYREGQLAALGGAGVQEPGIAYPRELIDRLGEASERLPHLWARVQDCHRRLRDQASDPGTYISKQAREAGVGSWVADQAAQAESAEWEAVDHG